MASTAAATSNGISLKILVDTKSQRVVFAEAGKDFVDFLYNISYLPVGTVMKLLANHGVGGCLDNIYHSIENSSQTIIHPSLEKDDILNPKCVTFSASDLQTLPKIQTSTSSTFYACKNSYRDCKAPTAANARAGAVNPLWDGPSCPGCYHSYSAIGKLVEPSKIRDVEKGFVKGEVTYIVMDDLTVKLASAISAIDIVNGFDIKNAGILEARVVHLENENALKLLKASIQSKTVLTDVFLRDKIPKDSK